MDILIAILLLFVLIVLVLILAQLVRGNNTLDWIKIYTQRK